MLHGICRGVGASKPATSIQENLMQHRLLAVASSAFLLAAAFVPSAATHAAEYPTGPITLIVPFGPGGSADSATEPHVPHSVQRPSHLGDCAPRPVASTVRSASSGAAGMSMFQIG